MGIEKWIGSKKKLISFLFLLISLFCHSQEETYFHTSQGESSIISFHPFENGLIYTSLRPYYSDTSSIVYFLDSLFRKTVIYHDYFTHRSASYFVKKDGSIDILLHSRGYPSEYGAYPNDMITLINYNGQSADHESLSRTGFDSRTNVQVRNDTIFMLVEGYLESSLFNLRDYIVKTIPNTRDNSKSDLIQTQNGNILFQNQAGIYNINHDELTELYMFEADQEYSSFTSYKDSLQVAINKTKSAIEVFDQNFKHQLASYPLQTGDHSQYFILTTFDSSIILIEEPIFDNSMPYYNRQRFYYNLINLTQIEELLVNNEYHLIDLIKKDDRYLFNLRQKIDPSQHIIHYNNILNSQQPVKSTELYIDTIIFRINEFSYNSGYYYDVDEYYFDMEIDFHVTNSGNKPVQFFNIFSYSLWERLGLTDFIYWSPLDFYNTEPIAPYSSTIVTKVFQHDTPDLRAIDSLGYMILGADQYLNLSTQYYKVGPIPEDAYPDLTVSVIETKSDNLAYTYPNPSNSNFTILGDLDPKSEVSIYTIDGLLVWQGTVIETIECSNWKPGVYLIKIQSSESSTTIKHIKQ